MYGTEVGITVSAIICTHNGAKVLEKAIFSLRNQDYPDNLYEIIVVDNVSTDETPEGWLSSLVRVYAERNAACVGGKVVPVWSAPSPNWLPEELHLYLTIVDMGGEVRELFGLEYPAGTNISFRRTALERVGLFDPSLGRRGKLLLSGDEDELCSRLEKAGYKRFYTPDAVVHHVVPVLRLNKRWFIRRAYWQGRSSSLQREPRIFVGQAKVSASPRAVVRHAWQALWSAVRRRPKHSFLHLFSLAFNVGYACGRLLGRRTMAGL